MLVSITVKNKEDGNGRLLSDVPGIASGDCRNMFLFLCEKGAGFLEARRGERAGEAFERSSCPGLCGPLQQFLERQDHGDPAPSGRGFFGGTGGGSAAVWIPENTAETIHRILNAECAF